MDRSFLTQEKQRSFFLPTVDVLFSFIGNHMNVHPSTTQEFQLNLNVSTV